MIRILYVLNGAIRLGGTEKVAEAVFDSIDREMFHIDFMLHCSREDQEDNGFFRKILDSGSEIFYVTPRYKSISGNRRDICAVLRENSFDMIHTHMDAAGAIVLHYAKKCGCAVRIAHSHNTNHQNIYSGLKKNVYKIIEDAMRYWVRREANCYIACSRDASCWLFGKRLTESGRTHILCNAIDSQAYGFSGEKRDKVREHLKIGGRFAVGTVGRICEAKNTFFLLDIMRELVKKDSGAVLLHVGPGDASGLIRRAREYGIEGNVIFYGPTENVAEILDAMDVFVLPSLWEGLGIAGLEAQANGLPVLVSTAVPKECAALNCRFVSLDSGAEGWVSAILNAEPCSKREDAWREIRGRSRFDQTYYTGQLEKIYLELYRPSAE